MAVLKSLKEYIASYLYIQWRSHLSGDLQANYFLNLAYYRLNVLTVSRKKRKASQLPNAEKSIPNDNVDQRITQDVDKMASSLSFIVPEIIVSPFIIGKLCSLFLGVDSSNTNPPCVFSLLRLQVLHSKRLCGSSWLSGLLPH